MVFGNLELKKEAGEKRAATSRRCNVVTSQCHDACVGLSHIGCGRVGDEFISVRESLLNPKS